MRTAIHDLNASHGTLRAAADVCVIGSGPAGLTLARALAERNVSVAIVEAGSELAAVGSAAHSVSFGRSEYRGATHGRAFGLGGTSSIWGGQLLPLRREEMQARPSVGALRWPIEHDEIAKHYRTILGWVGVDDDPFDAATQTAPESPLARLQWQGLNPRYSKWIPFRRRNLATSWLPQMLASGRIQLWINATVCEWSVGPGGRVRKVVAHGTSGQRLHVECAAVAICAGALESARLVLELAEQGALHEQAASLAGRFLQDHLSIRIGRVRPIERRRFAELFAPVFRGTTLRSPRLDLSPAAGSHELPAAYLHFVTEFGDNSGIAALRDTLRHVQAGRAGGALRSAARLLHTFPDLVELAYWRIARRRLIFPADAAVFVQLDFEQPQCFENRLYLGDVRDSRGRRCARIDWETSCDPRRLVSDMTRELRSFWEANRLGEIAQLTLFGTQATGGAPIDKPYDIHHPAGTTRMADDPADGVVDRNLKVYGMANCYVASTSAFPSIGAANPTLTLMALAMRLADHLATIAAAPAATSVQQALNTVHGLPGHSLHQN
jgi:GMC oxidoreductase/FAD binding domain